MTARSRRVMIAVCVAFYVLQAGFAVWAAVGASGPASPFFAADKLGMLFFAILAIISPLVFWVGLDYLKEEALPRLKLYNFFTMALCFSLAGVYFANNIAVTWIFVEVTTLCAAGLVYHRRTAVSLEATWKYLFVCSTGIAIAYLGILLLGTAASGGDMTYDNLAGAVSSGNPLYMKMAFLFILAGYSCKLEIFPLYTVGVDANSAAPAPASALISTALVNGGFVALYRAYKLFSLSAFYPWMGNVLILAGVVSVMFGAFFLRRTNHYKRFLAYSTVENMGIALIGLGIGGVGVFAAILHLTAHSLVKSGLFLQMSRVGRMYGTYRINRIGGYMAADPTGAATLMVLVVLLLAFPPSGLFFSEVMILGKAFATGKWWLAAVVVLMVCVVIYTFMWRIFQLCYKPSAVNAAPDRERSRMAALALALLSLVLGIWQAQWFIELLNGIVQ